ncbi:endonuclease/exonuclease/phosphatase family protein [Reyranella sp.]|uniref:endonuclease/exonuclease/phosphatase family protein n=1 Tax=Reyranella sp. TaxID=1929291 RepID=UPI00272FB9D0|nr:endonuclease/exonuclease/phosphatase family protein [Reyranella sp.]MDP2372545.1 endonuclease/exonuclease/phosphatase family protein [Reyranella sp.]
MSRAPVSRAPVNRARVMTWNIHGAFGRNPRFDLGRVVALVKRHAPDIVALQEIDSRRAREAHIGDPFDVLQQALGAHGARARAIVAADGEYGQALISRWPLVDTEIRDLSFPEREPRRAICSDVATPFGPLRVIATHLGLSLHERRLQAATLLGLLGALDRPTVALGDFNDWFWAGSVRRSLARVLPGCARHRTFPSWLPMFQLDRVYLWPPQALLGSHTDPEARAISDHLPVIADIAVGLE